MIDKIIAQPIARNRGFLEIARGLDQRSRCTGDIFRSLIGAGNRWCGELQAFFNAVQARRQHRRHREVRIHIGTRAARLQACCLGAASDDTKTCRTVIDPPSWFDRCPESIDQSLVTIDRWPHHRPELHQARHLPREVAFEHLAHSAFVFRVKKKIILSVRHALMNMSTASRQGRIPLGHEAGHDAEPRADFLRPGLEQNRAVSGFQCFAELDRDFIYSRSSLGMQAFDRHAKHWHFIHECCKKFTAVIHAQQGIPEHARRNRLRSHTFFRRP